MHGGAAKDPDVALPAHRREFDIPAKGVQKPKQPIDGEPIEFAPHEG